MSRKQIIMQAVAASAVVGVIGVTGNMVMQDRAVAVQARTVSVLMDEAAELQPPEDFQVLGGDEVQPPRERAMEEHGEPHEGDRSANRGLGGTYEFELGDPIPMEIEDRSIAIKRLEDIYARLDEPNVPPQEREMLEVEKHDLLVEHFGPPAAAGEALPPTSTSEPFTAPVEEKAAYSGFDVNNLFNKVWGLFQGLILAWVPYRFYKRKDE